MGEKMNNSNPSGCEADLITELTHDLEESYALPDFQARQFAPLTLAYIGDGIYELIVRTLLVRQSDAPVHKLHRRASSLVKAETQAEMIGYLQENGLLTEEEEQVFHRGRNAKAFTRAKNASIQEYRRATGFEAVCGYLYLKGDMKRLIGLVSCALDAHFQRIGDHSFSGQNNDGDPENHTGNTLNV
ncbi:MAG: Mini-ribonuclease 3 [Bilifractor sp.]